MSTADSTERRMTIARAFARQMLQRRGEPVTPEPIEREATNVATGLYVESLEDELPLSKRFASNPSQGPQP